MKEMLDATMMRRSLVRMAHEIVERNKGTENVVLVGIKSKGVPIAKRLSEIIESFEEAPVPYAELDIQYWRDDHKKSEEKVLELALEVHDKKVVLCDDVLFTGRSVRAAMDAIMDHGRA